MGQTSDTFSDKVRAKANDADKRLKDFAAKAEKTGQKAKADAKAYLDSLNAKIKAQQAQIEANQANQRAQQAQNQANQANQQAQQSEDQATRAFELANEADQLAQHARQNARQLQRV